MLADGPDLARLRSTASIAAWREPAAMASPRPTGAGAAIPSCLAPPRLGGEPDEGARTLGAVPVPCDDLGAPGDVDFVDPTSPGRFLTAADELRDEA